MGFNVAIDGPSGAGKSTIAKQAARYMNFIYVDTGAMYRALAVYFIRQNIAADDTEQIKKVIGDAHVHLAYVDNQQIVFLNNEDVTSLLRSEEVGKMASDTAQIPEVRAALLDLQKKMAASHDVIMDGRDIGTQILPHADVKIFLTASVDTRAFRRYKELVERGIDCDLDAIKKDIQHRDDTDMNREIAPLSKAVDAIEVDSSDLSIEETVKQVTDLILMSYKRT